MLADLRSLGPKVWTTAHEVAVVVGGAREASRYGKLGCPPTWVRAYVDFLTILDDETGSTTSKVLFQGSLSERQDVRTPSNNPHVVTTCLYKGSRWWRTCIGIQVVGQRHVVGWPTPCRLRLSR